MQVQIWAETLLADRVLERKLISTIEREAVVAGSEEFGLGPGGREGSHQSKYKHISFKHKRRCWKRLTDVVCNVGGFIESRIGEVEACAQFSVEFECLVGALNDACVWQASHNLDLGPESVTRHDAVNG